MRRAATFRAPLASGGAAAFQRLEADLRRDDDLRVLGADASRMEVRGEGSWWFHGRWRVEGDELALEVFSKATGLQALAAWLPIRQALRTTQLGLDALARRVGDPSAK
ncbi:MAG TPA: hypothetical protein VM241_04600 [Candidatus Thermoplasmatota archaeon]|nr:hypothetical protein [Candidatus Thermoplasmatota archaeon]